MTLLFYNSFVLQTLKEKKIIISVLALNTSRDGAHTESEDQAGKDL